jgi:hypothetical protein
MRIASKSRARARGLLALLMPPLNSIQVVCLLHSFNSIRLHPEVEKNRKSMAPPQANMRIFRLGKQLFNTNNVWSAQVDNEK